MSKHPYIREVPVRCAYPGCGGNMAKDYDVKYSCLRCGRPFDWNRKRKGKEK